MVAKLDNKICSHCGRVKACFRRNAGQSEAGKRLAHLSNAAMLRPPAKLSAYMERGQNSVLADLEAAVAQEVFDTEPRQREADAEQNHLMDDLGSCFKVPERGHSARRTWSTIPAMAKLFRQGSFSW
jgi:hypothetical protein